MERTRLTSNLSFEIFGVICLPIVLYMLVSGNELNFYSKLILFIIFGLFALLLYFLLTLKTIDFDDNYVYLISNSKEEIIPIENITYIKLTMSGINSKDFWEMRYINENNEEISLSFVPKSVKATIFTLEELIKLKNPEADIENHASSLDFIRDIIKVYRIIKSKFKK